MGGKWRCCGVERSELGLSGVSSPIIPSARQLGMVAAVFDILSVCDAVCQSVFCSLYATVLVRRRRFFLLSTPS